MIDGAQATGNVCDRITQSVHSAGLWIAAHKREIIVTSVAIVAIAATLYAKGYYDGVNSVPQGSSSSGTYSFSIKVPPTNKQKYVDCVYGGMNKELESSLCKRGCFAIEKAFYSSLVTKEQVASSFMKCVEICVKKACDELFKLV